MLKSVTGPILIMIASSLWAIDAIFRTQLTFTIQPATIVMIEHAVGFIFLSPFVFKNFNDIKKLQKKHWLAILTMTTVSSVLGALLFTKAIALSFASYDFVTPVLLQKLQPIFVIGLSAVFLKEKINLKFVILVLSALLGSYLISFDFKAVNLKLEGRELVFLLSVMAALSWGSGTILSKYILSKLNFETASALRFMIAVPIAFIFTIFLKENYNLLTLKYIDIFRFLIIATLTGGALAIYLYYKGLQKTQAKISTIAELMFPVTAVIIATTNLNPYGEPQILTIGKIIGIILLVSSILGITYLEKLKLK